MEIRREELKRTATGIKRKQKKRERNKKDAEREKRRTKKGYQKVRGESSTFCGGGREEDEEREKGA